MSWFPLAKEVMENPEFQQLSPLDKLVYWELVSEFNEHKEFYKADLELAVKLDCSQKAIQRARKKLASLGLVEYIPGHHDAYGRGLATRYTRVRYAATDETRQWAKQDRHTFNLMLHLKRQDVFTAADLVVYLVLSYWHGLYADDQGDFFIQCHDLKRVTGLSRPYPRMVKLTRGFSFRGGQRLFDYSGMPTLYITRWAIAASPEKSERSRAQAREFEEEVKAAIQQRREARESAGSSGASPHQDTA